MVPSSLIIFFLMLFYCCQIAREIDCYFDCEIGFEKIPESFIYKAFRSVSCLRSCLSICLSNCSRN